MTDTSALWALSPLDGRYREKLAGLEQLVSEGALNRYRIQVETLWLSHLLALPSVVEIIGQKADPSWFSPPPWEVPGIIEVVKERERITNHDVKACEYALREELERRGAPDNVLAFVHFACTSEDINNLSYALMLKDVAARRILPLWDEVIARLQNLAAHYKDLAMLARTHGQTASPTTLGKEMAVFGHRLMRVRDELGNLKQLGKMNGAVGAYNAHVVTFPDIDWQAISESFVTSLGLAWNPLTTQIENHDSIAAFADCLRRSQVVMIGLCRDIWSYISIGYFRQPAVAGEVGSSTMPHKINPIDFENAEGNFGIANALATHFTDKLLISRWQRDLSDSTVLRTIGTLAGHAELGLRSMLKGLGKIDVNEARIAQDLDESWEVLGEAVQTVLRRYGVKDAYERLKEATRGQSVTRDSLHQVIDASVELPSVAKDRLKALTPATYTGLASTLAASFAKNPRGGL